MGNILFMCLDSNGRRPSGVWLDVVDDAENKNEVVS